VCVSMKSVTASPSQPLLDRLANGNAPQSRPSLWSIKKILPKKASPLNPLRELAVRLI
jgi:hypothetical protein